MPGKPLLPYSVRFRTDVRESDVASAAGQGRSSAHPTHAAATPATDSILRGVAITPNAPGTNPIWYDPARWYSDLHPQFSLDRQLTVIGILGAEYIASLAPMFLVIAFWLIVAGREGVAEWWRRTWPVVVPASPRAGSR